MEIDGDPVMHEIKPSAPCPLGSSKRKAVPSAILDAFPSCCGGRAHLIPDFLVPSEFQAKLAKGANGTLCVPDEFATSADYAPRSCTSVLGVKGACLSECLPEVKNARVKLPLADCKAGELCAPCFDPQTKQRTGACDIGPMACETPEAIDDCKPYSPTLDLSSYKTCCGTGPAHCAPSSLVPEGQRKDLQLCSDGQSYCVPDDILSRGGKHQPATCKSVGGREGRCLSVCVKSVADQLSTLPQSSCKSYERCAPCYDPRTGMGTGACTVGPCDKPKEPAKKFQACGAGTDDAMCVPSDLVPSSDRCHFDSKGCGSGCTEANTLCVPKKVIDAGVTYEPKKCKASMSGFLAFFMTFFSNPFTAFSKMKEYSDGRCLSKCLKQVKANPSSKMLSSTGCDATEVCVPCYDPTKLSQGKVPTGACHRSCS